MRKDPQATARMKDFSQPSSSGCLPPWFGKLTSVQLRLQTYIFSFSHPILFQGSARKSPPGIAQMKYFSQVKFVGNSNVSFAAPVNTVALHFLAVLMLLIFIYLFILPHHRQGPLSHCAEKDCSQAISLGRKTIMVRV